MELGGGAKSTTYLFEKFRKKCIFKNKYIVGSKSGCAENATTFGCTTSFGCANATTFGNLAFFNPFRGTTFGNPLYV